MKYIIILTTICFGLSLSAQNADQNVIASSGGYFETGSASISYTIGEIAIGTFSSGSTTLTQGFQQSFIEVSTIVEETELSNLKVYPNPVNNFLHVESPELGKSYKLTNSLGNVIYNGEINGYTKIDFSNLPNGLYFLEVDGSKTHKIVK